MSLRVLIACEFSGIVRNAFLAKGLDAWSCDLLPTEDIDNEDRHLQCDVMEILSAKWDLMIAHPPCTYLAVSGARWFKDRREGQEHALQFVCDLMNAPIPHIAIENPISVISTRIRKPDQIIQPYWFGVGDQKSTCLWLNNLPLLYPTSMSRGRYPKTHWMGPSKDRSKMRSRTYPCIAEAMADQWSRYLLSL